MNAIITPAVFDRYKDAVLSETFIVVDGPLQNVDGVISLNAERVGAVRRGPAGRIARLSLRCRALSWSCVTFRIKWRSSVNIIWHAWPSSLTVASGQEAC